VFRAILAAQADAGETGPEIMEDSAALPKAIAYRLHAGSYRSVSVLPVRFARFLAALWAGPRFALQLWGSLGALYGVLALLAAPALIGWAAEMRGVWRFAEQDRQTVRFLGSAALLGYNLRMFLAARFQVTHERARQVTRAHAFAVVALIVATAVWMRGASALLLGWGAVLRYAAFAAADQLCRRISQVQPEYMERAD
jgi:hypothetical protein